jgi:hypothetical protein
VKGLPDTPENPTPFTTSKSGEESGILSQIAGDEYSTGIIIFSLIPNPHEPPSSTGNLSIGPIPSTIDGITSHHGLLQNLYTISLFSLNPVVLAVITTTTTTNLTPARGAVVSGEEACRD